jgi:tRNA(Ile)-lysidine synthase TilS/MesJ
MASAISAAEFAASMACVLAESARGRLLRAAAPVRCVVAVSGGPDSVALLSLLSEFAAAPASQLRIGAVVTVDHGLRGPRHTDF